jgi:hypothetical protein
VLGVSIYAYTSARVLPLTFWLYGAVRLRHAAENRMDLLRRYAAVLAGAVVTSIPNLLFLIRRPHDLLFAPYLARIPPLWRVSHDERFIQLPPDGGATADGF